MHDWRAAIEEKLSEVSRVSDEHRNPSTYIKFLDGHFFLWPEIQKIKIFKNKKEEEEEWEQRHVPETPQLFYST